MTTLLPGTSFTFTIQPVYDLRDCAGIAIHEGLAQRIPVVEIDPAVFKLDRAMSEARNRYEQELAVIRDRAVAELGLPQDAAIDPENGYRYV